MNPNATAFTLSDSSDEFGGYTLAIPIEEMDPSREAESGQTAYIYLTVLEERLRGQKLVGKLTDSLFIELAQKGYKFVERDAQLGNGYADAITRNYGDSILKSYDHNRFPEVGPERFFRIDIERYLTSKGLSPNSQE